MKPGNLVFFHDGGGNREQTVKALKIILSELEKQGNKFVTISELVEVEKGRNNDKDKREELKGNKRKNSKISSDA